MARLSPGVVVEHGQGSQATTVKTRRQKTKSMDQLSLDRPARGAVLPDGPRSCDAWAACDASGDPSWAVEPVKPAYD